MVYFDLISDSVESGGNIPVFTRRVSAIAASVAGVATGFDPVAAAAPNISVAAAATLFANRLFIQIPFRKMFPEQFLHLLIHSATTRVSIPNISILPQLLI